MADENQPRAELRFKPYVGASGGFIVRTAPLDIGTWMLPDDLYSEQIAAKIERLEQRRAFHYRSLPQSLTAQHELRDVLVANLLQSYPNDFALDGSIFHTRINGCSFDLDDPEIEPLDQLSRFVMEDFIMLEPGDSNYRVTAASNTHATSGRLVKAVGRDIGWAHDPVPGLNTRYGKLINRMMHHLHVDRPFERFTWSLMPVGGIFAGAEQLEAISDTLPALWARLIANPELFGSQMWIRVERQTMRKLPVTGAAIFTIHTYSDPLALLAGHPQAAAGMRDVIASYTDVEADYLLLSDIRPALMDWLDSIAASGAQT